MIDYYSLEELQQLEEKRIKDEIVRKEREMQERERKELEEKIREEIKNATGEDVNVVINDNVIVQRDLVT